MTTMLLEWFATAVFLILAVLALRAVFGKRVSAGLRYALWGAVLLRLLVPVQLFTSPLAGTLFTVWTETNQSVDAVPAGEWTAPFLGAYQPDTPFPTGPAFDHERPGTFPSEIHFLEPPPVPEVPDAPEAPGPDWAGWVWLGAVWLAGSLVTALVFLICNLRFWRQLQRTRKPLETEQAQETRAHDMRPYTELAVYTAEGLPSPCLFGLLRPAIYVTPEAAADPAVLRHVLAHEDTHFRHGDHIWNLLRCAALCLHWWNPLVWLSAVLSRRDGELSCDEGALKRLGDEERAAYGNTLLTLITAPADPGSLLRCATTMAGDKKSLVERISRIARAPKKWLWAAVAAALCLALACVCAFGQKAEETGLDPDLWAEGVNELVFVQEQARPGGQVYIQLNRDNKFNFCTRYNGEICSDVGTGVWMLQDDGILCLEHHGYESDTPRTAMNGPLFYYFKTEKDTLVFQAMRSDAMPYVSLNNGERFKLEPGQTPSLDAELTFYVRTSEDGRPYVRINGTVDGMELPRGATWDPNSLWGKSPSGELSVVYPGFEGLGQHVNAWWSDEDRTSVTLTTYMSAGFSSLFNVGYWEFTVDLDSGTLTSMEGLPRDGLLDEETTFYPESISDEQAVRAARVAAKLMEAAEEYYNSAAEPAPTQSEEPKEDLNPSESPAPAEEADEDPVFTDAEVMPPAEDLANMTELPYHPDLNRNGVPETLLVGQYCWWAAADNGPDDAYPMLAVGVWEDGELLWSSASPRIGGDQQAYLLVDLDSGDYLLYYCDCARFILFDLAGGKPHILSEQTLSYTLSPAEKVEEGFDPETIAGFVDTVDPLLARSKVLVDENSVFTGKELKVDFTWLGNYVEGFTWDETAARLENLTRFKAIASQPEPAPVPAGAETVRQAKAELLDTLLGKRSFTYYTYEKNIPQAKAVDINTAPSVAFFNYSETWKEYGNIWNFAVVDLDGDNIPEAVLQTWAITAEMGGYLILHWTGPGDVRCYPSYWRTFWDLKTDGTFYYDYYMGVDGIARVSFPAPGYRMDQHSIIEGRIDMSVVSDPPKGTFTVNGKSVSYEEYEAAHEAQREKPDAQWYEFTPENIIAALE